ncbi:hypothetical protein ABC345_09830 [Shouchella sp. 1P09AA]|uniref:hypothetical protein n=1 Tax=unclassified Shouchella TaxID=2893065 RepID=UPI0039A06C8A
MKILFFAVAIFFLVYGTFEWISGSKSLIKYLYLVIGIAFIIVGITHEAKKKEV